MKGKWNGLRNQALYGLNCSLGKAVKRLDFYALRLESSYAQLKAFFEEKFQLYKPHEWEPLHSFYLAQLKRLPSDAQLKEQAAVCSAEFMLIIKKMKLHQLAPDYLQPLIQPEEVALYYHLAQRYFQRIEQGDSWPLAFFYGIAPHIIRKRHAAEDTVTEFGADVENIRCLQLGPLSI